MMVTKVNELTVDQLKALINELIDEKLEQMLNDPDEGLILKEEFGKKLKASLAAVHQGKPGVTLEKIANDLGFVL
jgi:hypothetical protein